MGKVVLIIPGFPLPFRTRPGHDGLSRKVPWAPPPQPAGRFSGVNLRHLPGLPRLSRSGGYW
jgi:hypothetical protein